MITLRVHRFLKRLIPALFLMKFGVFSSLTIAAPEPAARSVEQRLAILEAYLTNTDPAAAHDSVSKQVSAPSAAPGAVTGPGHNAWMMISAALVLFMTLPGLALFYGGLVRKRQLLSQGLPWRLIEKVVIGRQRWRQAFGLFLLTE